MLKQTRKWSSTTSLSKITSPYLLSAHLSKLSTANTIAKPVDAQRSGKTCGNVILTFVAAPPMATKIASKKLSQNAESELTFLYFLLLYNINQIQQQLNNRSRANYRARANNRRTCHEHLHHQIQRHHHQHHH